MRRLKPKYKTLFIGTGILIYFFVALGFIEKEASQQRCTKVKVSILDSNENMFISALDVDKILEKNEFNIIGYPVKVINTLLIEKAIEKHSSIETAHVYANLKGNIHVRIIQRKPILRVMERNGESYYMDDKGFLMPLSKNFTTRVPVVTGHIKKSYQKFKSTNFNTSDSDTLLQNLFFLSKELNQNKYWSAMCDQLYISKKQEISLIPKIGAKEIILGQNQAFSQDLKTLTVFYKEVLPVVGWEKYKTINLKFKQQIICK